MLHLPDNLTEIGEEAFSGCISLTGGINGGDKLAVIGRRAFAGCANFGTPVADGEISDNEEDEEDA